ncbi:hypothetical protein B0I35DRAFT_321439, partial [Stachybotrys elegans]
MRLPLFLIESDGMPRNHQGLLVQTDDEEKSGRLFHVHGNIQQGMSFETRYPEKPESSPTFLSRRLLGWVQESSLEKIEQICRSNPAPAKQFDGPRRIDPRQPLRRCQEWTKETIELLRSQGVLEAENS